MTQNGTCRARVWRTRCARFSVSGWSRRRRDPAGGRQPTRLIAKKERMHRVIDARGTKRIIMWSGLYPARLARSEDDGRKAAVHTFFLLAPGVDDTHPLPRRQRNSGSRPDALAGQGSNLQPPGPKPGVLPLNYPPPGSPRYRRGVTGQTGAVRHGLARALLEMDPELRPKMRQAGFLTRDARMKERKKYGRKGARKRRRGYMVKGEGRITVDQLDRHHPLDVGQNRFGRDGRVIPRTGAHHDVLDIKKAQHVARDGPVGLPALRKALLDPVDGGLVGDLRGRRSGWR